MSLSIEKKRPKRESVPIGIIDDDKKAIWVSKGIEKSKRVKELKVDKSISYVPYLDKVAKQRSAVYISGVSGSGKSTICIELIENLRMRLDKKNNTKCILFTITKELDPAFESLPNLVHFPFTDDIFGVNTEMLSDTIVVFDDFTSIINKKLKDFVQGLIHDILERARKMNIQVFIISHQTQNFLQTRNIIFESDTFVLNPSSNFNSTKKFLKAYGELEPQQIDQILAEEVPHEFCWLLYRKSYPRFIIYNKKITIL